jgi:hypothetical protein
MGYRVYTRFFVTSQPPSIYSETLRAINALDRLRNLGFNTVQCDTLDAN